ncbi:helicase swr-1-like [Homarus americanus]|uniref:helicase swr-1-like n=1 Tax=Homarus americanus TaxID=6706 RepID=UPI001C45DF5A|nr:helicase swr-1-like [Homarus americanus]
MSSLSSDDFFDDVSDDNKKRERNSSPDSRDASVDESKTSSYEEKSLANVDKKNSSEVSQERYDSESEDLENSVSEENEIVEDLGEKLEQDEHDVEDKYKQNDSNDESEELENLFNGSQSNPSCSISSQASKSSRLRPTSARNPMRVLISSASSTHQSKMAALSHAVVPIATAADEETSFMPRSSLSPLLVYKSPVHDRLSTSRGSRDTSSKPPQNTKPPQLTTSNKGINRVLSSKENSSKMGCVQLIGVQ